MLRIKAFAAFLRDHYESSVDKFLAQDTLQVRAELLALPGITDFTADNILLYAGHRRLLPINQRLKKVLSEHDYLNRNDAYDVAQQRLAGSRQEHCTPENTAAGRNDLRSHTRVLF